jgi:predicted transcriptional regulator
MLLAREVFDPGHGSEHRCHPRASRDHRCVLRFAIQITIGGTGISAISLRLPEDLDRKLAAEAELVGRPRSEVVRDALVEYLAEQERKRFMAEFIAEAKKGYGDPEMRREAIEIAEEHVALSNEAMDLAEGRQPGEPWPEDQGERWRK